jgi:transposase InsO family protein
MHNFAGNNSRLLRRSLRLSEFDFVVEHRPDTQIRHADGFSRAMQAVTQDVEISCDEIKTAQDEDKFCQSLKPGPASGKQKYFKDEEGFIFRRRQNGEQQLVVPLILARRVVKANHYSVTAAHPGRNRTLDILCRRFYWPGMSSHVEDYVKNCNECQRLKPRHEFKAPLREVMEPTRPWEVVAIDICGPFPITTNKNRYLLTFLNQLTKYAEAVSLATMTAEPCARAYVTNVIARHGARAKLLSDHGRNFTSAFFRETCKILGLKQLFTTAWHPMSNGFLGRFLRSMAEALLHYVNTNGNNWHDLIPLYLMAYRNTPHGATTHSPYSMLHGREMVLPPMQSLRAKLSSDIRNIDHAPGLEKVKSRLRTVYKLPREHSRK